MPQRDDLAMALAVLVRDAWLRRTAKSTAGWVQQPAVGGSSAEKDALYYPDATTAGRGAQGVER